MLQQRYRVESSLIFGYEISEVKSLWILLQDVLGASLQSSKVGLSLKCLTPRAQPGLAGSCL
jgi:hypothetical protein